MMQGPNDWRLNLAAPARPILEGLLVNLRRQLAAADVGFRLRSRRTAIFRFVPSPDLNLFARPAVHLNNTRAARPAKARIVRHKRRRIAVQASPHLPVG